MISRPHQSADQSDSGKADDLRQLRHKKSPPSDFLAECAGDFADHPEGRRNEHENKKRERWRKILPTEVRTNFRQDRSIESAEPGEPDDKIDRQRVTDRNEIRQKSHSRPLTNR